MQTIDYTAKLPVLQMITDSEGTEEEVQAFCFAINQEEFIYLIHFVNKLVFYAHILEMII